MVIEISLFGIISARQKGDLLRDWLCQGCAERRYARRPVQLIEYEMDQGEKKMIEITFGMALDGAEREERK